MTSQVNGVTKTGLRTLIVNDKTRISVFKSMENLYDVTKARMSVHLREYSDGHVEVIINRSCDECTDFRSINSHELICSKCSYVKGWLEDGCY